LAFDEDGAARPTIINPGEVWTKKSRKWLLSPEDESTLEGDAIIAEKNKAFDLIDALSRSGGIPFDEASLHVVIASTYCFGKSLVNTIIQDNKNPIEKLERTSLIVANTLHGKPVNNLLIREQRSRVKTYSPMLFPEKEKKPTKKSRSSKDKGTKAITSPRSQK